MRSTHVVERMVDIRGLPLLCHEHLQRASAIYNGQELDEVKQSALSALLAESQSCHRCVRLREGKTKPSVMNPHGKPSWERTRLVECLPYESVDFFSSPKNRRAELEKRGLYPPPVLPAALKQQ